MLIVETAFIFSKVLHHRFWISDFRRGLGVEGEAEWVEQELVEMPFATGL